METYRITSDIERVETSITLAGRRLGVRAALILLAGGLLSSGLVGTLAPTLGSPLLFMPLGLMPIYIAALVAFVRPGDGRALEAQLVDRIRFARAPKVLVNLGHGEMEMTTKVLNLAKEAFSVADVREGDEVKAEVSELDLPLTVRGHGDLRIAINDLRITVRLKEGGDEVALTIQKA
jgi:hypothetical protein